MTSILWTAVYVDFRFDHLSHRTRKWREAKTWSLCSWPVGDRSKALNAVNAVLKRDDTGVGAESAGVCSARAAYLQRRSSNANSLQSQNSAGFPQICAIFQRDLRRHF
jgi:hypothetical protein